MKASVQSEALVFFGAARDLAHKKVLPARYALVHEVKVDARNGAVLAVEDGGDDNEGGARQATRTERHN